MKMNTYYVYILSNKSRTLYIGVTNNLERRLYKHKNKLVPGFSKKYNNTKLFYFEITGDSISAINSEKQLKGWLRKRKVELFESKNSEWEDLSNNYEKF